MSGNSTQDHPTGGRPGSAGNDDHMHLLILIGLAIEEAEDRQLRRTAGKLLDAMAALREDRTAAMLERTLAVSPGSPAGLAPFRRLTAANDR